MVDFKISWRFPISETEWENMFSESFSDGDRKYIYSYILEYSKISRPMTFAEVGFAQCFDFRYGFKKLHDDGYIVYNGFDITSQFVNYAKQAFPTYNFTLQNFFENSDMYDITYCRAVIEHQPPESMYSAFDKMLLRANKLAIISWFYRPSNEVVNWTTSSRGGAYVNCLDKTKTDSIIQKHNFKLMEVRDPSFNNMTIYIMEKRDLLRTM